MRDPRQALGRPQHRDPTLAAPAAESSRCRRIRSIFTETTRKRRSSLDLETDHDNAPSRARHVGRRRVRPGWPARDDARGAARHPRHRRRLRRHLHGHCLAACRKPAFPDPRESERGRRRVARQQLSRRRLRCAIAPVFVFVCAESGLVASLCNPARDSRLPARLRPALRPDAVHPLRACGRGCLLRRGARSLGAAHRGGRLPARPDRGDRHRPAQPAGHAAHRRHRRLPWAQLSFGQLGSCLSTARQAGRRDRHRGLGHPVRAGDRGPGRRPAGLPAFACLPDRARRPGLPGLAQTPVPPPAAGHAPASRAHLCKIRVAGAGFHPPEGHHAFRRRPTLPAHAGARRPGSGAARAPGAGLPDRLQARPAVRRLPGDLRPAKRQAGRRCGPAHRPGRRRDRRRHAAPGRCDHLRHRLCGERLPGADARRRPRRARPEHGVAQRRHGLPRHHGAGLPELFHVVWAKYQSRPQLDRLHARKPGRAHHALPARDAEGRRHDRRGRRRHAPGFQRQAARAARRRRLERLQQLVPGPARTQQRELARIQLQLQLARAPCQPGRLPLRRSAARTPRRATHQGAVRHRRAPAGGIPACVPAHLLQALDRAAPGRRHAACAGGPARAADAGGGRRALSAPALPWRAGGNPCAARGRAPAGAA